MQGEFSGPIRKLNFSEQRPEMPQIGNSLLFCLLYFSQNAKIKLILVFQAGEPYKFLEIYFGAETSKSDRTTGCLNGIIWRRKSLSESKKRTYETVVTHVVSQIKFLSKWK